MLLPCRAINDKNRDRIPSTAGPVALGQAAIVFETTQIRENILTEETLSLLVDLADEELSLYKRRAISRLDRLNREAEAVEQKLGHVYAALESGSVDIDDLAPRLEELRARQRELDEKKDEALDEMNQRGDSLHNLTAFRSHLGVCPRNNVLNDMRH